MGAKNHAIVLPDASVDATLNALVAAGFGAAGQRCMALSTVVFVGDSKPWYCEFYRSIFFLCKLNSSAHVRPIITLKSEGWKAERGLVYILIKGSLVF